MKIESLFVELAGTLCVDEKIRSGSFGHRYPTVFVTAKKHDYEALYLMTCAKSSERADCCIDSWHTFHIRKIQTVLSGLYFE